jgi:DNA-binding winged helix-turn-helix (wHTH) protein
MEVLSFGPYRLCPDSRLLEREGVTIQLGSRALEILIVLAERAGDLVSTKELISRVWRAGIIAPGTLRVHIAALRKALGDGRNGARYVSNAAGLGYCFVAPISVASHLAQRDSISVAAAGGSRIQALEQRVKELQRLLGMKTLQYEILKKERRGRSRGLRRAASMRDSACNDEQAPSSVSASHEHDSGLSPYPPLLTDVRRGFPTGSNNS